MSDTSNLSKQEKAEKQAELFNKIMWIPLVILLAVVPLIVKMVIIQADAQVMDVLNKSDIGDLYANYKSTAIVVLSAIMAIIVFLCIDKESIKFDKAIKGYMIGGGIFLGISLLSTILSKNSHVAWWGMPDRAEGFIMILCYIFLTLYTLYALRNQRNYTYIIGALSFLIVISTIIGAFQYFGYDLFTKVSFFKNLILGKEGRALNMSLTSDYNEGKVFGTMNHYNYMGSFGAMMVPFFMVLTLFIKNNKAKIGLGFITLCAMFLLFGSTSRAGFIGLVMAMLAALIVFGKKVIKRWQITVPVCIGIVAILFIFNAITHGTIFNRIPTLITESIGLFSGLDKNFDYKDHIPVRDIVHEDNKEKIVLQDNTLYLVPDTDKIKFVDENGQDIQYDMDETGQYTTKDQRFAAVTFKRETVQGLEEGQKEPAVISMQYNGLETFLFMLDDTKGVVMADSCPLQEQEIEYPETIGFRGKERLGSARGYIWSRSIPMMKKTFLTGNGPDTYALHFPQRDYLGKWWAYDTPNMLVDKAHSLYLGMWVNNGGLALIGFLAVIIIYLAQSFKLYAFQEYYETRDILGVATMLAVIGYLGAGFFNDSIVSVTPVFCILLGAGMGLNYLINKDHKEQEAKLRKVVPMKK